jgi:hypothetical protein
MSDTSAATESLVRIVSDIELCEEYWHEMAPCLKLLAVMRHRELAEKLAHILPDAMKTFAEQADEQAKDAMVRKVCRDFVIELGLYQQHKQN